MDDTTAEENEVDGLCPECGHAFKVYVDRVTSRGGAPSTADRESECPVCGCGECRIGR
jgi:hypothetical protein